MAMWLYEFLSLYRQQIVNISKNRSVSNVITILVPLNNKKKRKISYFPSKIDSFRWSGVLSYLRHFNCSFLLGTENFIWDRGLLINKSQFLNISYFQSLRLWKTPMKTYIENVFYRIFSREHSKTVWAGFYSCNSKS